MYLRKNSRMPAGKQVIYIRYTSNMLYFQIY